MKRILRYRHNEKIVEREISYIPFRYILAMLLALLEVAAIIAILVYLCDYVPHSYLAAWCTEIACVIRIIASDDNPDYKIPWLLLVLAVPVAGFMLYFLFYSRTLKRKFVRRLDVLHQGANFRTESGLLERLKAEDPVAAAQANMLCRISDTHIFRNTKQEYFPLGEAMFPQLIDDLKGAEKFIYMEYFIIQDGLFWNTILDVLKEKAASGVEIKVLYDDIGCMATLPGNYAKILRKHGIEAVPFSRLKGNADSEFNNRSHRKITVIDGRGGYTGGINLADEYINAVQKYGHWKDIAVRLEGEAVWEMTKLFFGRFRYQCAENAAISYRSVPHSAGYSGTGLCHSLRRRSGSHLSSSGRQERDSEYGCRSHPVRMDDDALPDHRQRPLHNH